MLQKQYEYPLGIFDSGVGGLTVLKELRTLMPNQNFIYVGDTARYPYGRKPPDMIIQFSIGIVNFLLQQGVKGIIVACNTASAVALPILQQLIPVPIWGVLEPGVEAASQVTQTGYVGLIGTKSTISVGVYQKLLERKKLRVWAQPCPMLVHIVEEGLSNSYEAKLLINYYLSTCPEIDTLILGCTHYPLLKDTIQDLVGNHVYLVNSAKATAEAVYVSDIAKKNKICIHNTGNVIHYVTGDALAYEHTAQAIGGVLGSIQRLDLSELSLLEKNNKPKFNA